MKTIDPAVVSDVAGENELLKMRLTEATRYLAVVLDSLGGKFEVSELALRATEPQVWASRSIDRPGVVVLSRTAGAALQDIERQENTRG